MPTKAPAKKRPATPPAESFGFAEIHVTEIIPSPDNLRRDLGDLTELAASIKSIGVTTALTVAPKTADGWPLAAGHRRLAAAILAGLEHVPCMVKDSMADDDRRQEAMIVENLQRKDLDPIEEAEGYERLVALGLDQRTIAERVGFSQSHIAKRLALRKLPVTLQDLVTTRKMTLETAALAAAASPAALAVLSGPAYIAQRGGELREYEVRIAEAKAQLGALIAKGLKTGLPHWTDEMGWNYDSCDRAEATHFLARMNAGKLQWVKKRSATKSSSNDNADVVRNKAALARARERREWVRPLLYSPDLEDVAIKALLLCPWLGLGIGGDDARIVLDWQYLRSTLPKDTKTAASDAWAKQRSAKAITGSGGRQLFALAVLSRIEENFTRFYSTGDSPAAALYLRTLARLGWTLDDVERKIVEKNAKDLAPDSAGIKATPQPELDPFTNSTIDEPVTTWVEPQLQPADDVPPSASCSSCSRPTTECGDLDTYGVCGDCNWTDSLTVDPAGDTPGEPATAPDSDAAWAAHNERAEAMRLERVALLPAAQLAWMEANEELSHEEPATFFEKTAVAKLRAAFTNETDIDYLRQAVAFEINRSDVVRRQDIIDYALERIAELDQLPGEHDVAHVLANSGKPMLDDDGEPTVCDDQETIAVNEKAGRVPPDKPWSTFDIAGEARLLETIAGITVIAKLEAAIPFEEFYKNRPKVLTAIRNRISTLTGEAAG